MVRTTHEGCYVHCVGFICDVSIGIEVPDLVRLFRGTGGVVFPLELTVFVEDVHEFLADFERRSFLFSFGFLD